MTPLQMIAEWRKGCGNLDAGQGPEHCHVCTVFLIKALERRLQETTFQRIVRKLKQWRPR